MTFNCFSLCYSVEGRHGVVPVAYAKSRSLDSREQLMRKDILSLIEQYNSKLSKLRSMDSETQEEDGDLPSTYEDNHGRFFTG